MLLAVVMLPTAGAFAYEPSTDPDEFFYDFPAMVEGATASMRKKGSDMDNEQFDRESSGEQTIHQVSGQSTSYAGR